MVVRKQKKKDNDPPLRLLDDLFRKTKATPCIYWLPLTPEQVKFMKRFFLNMNIRLIKAQFSYEQEVVDV